MAKLQGTETHCKRGHERNEANTNKSGKCKPCMALAVAKFRVERGITSKPQEVGVSGSKRGTATHCKRGHERAVYGVIRGGRSQCSECVNLAIKAWREANQVSQEVKDLKAQIRELQKQLDKATKKK